MSEVADRAAEITTDIGAAAHRRRCLAGLAAGAGADHCSGEVIAGKKYLGVNLKVIAPVADRHVLRFEGNE